MEQSAQPPQTLGTPLATFREKTAYGATIKIGFYFLTYEWSRRRLSLIKVIHGEEEVLMFLFTTFKYEYLFWSDVVRVWIVKLFILEKIRIQKAHDEISGEKNVSTKLFRVFVFHYLDFIDR